MPLGVLRPLELNDAPEIARACADEDIARWTQIPHPYGLTDAQSFITSKGHEDHVWAIDVDGLVGVVGVRDTRATMPGPVAEIGYWVAPWARGRGIATQAVIAVRDELQRVGYQRIDWEALCGNEASLRVARKAGFTIEGERRQGMVHRGRLVDCVVGGWTHVIDVAELVAGQWQLQPVRPDEVDAELRPHAGSAQAVWAVRSAVGGDTHGHVMAMRSVHGVHVVGFGAADAAVDAARRYAVAQGWDVTEQPLPADWL